MRHKLLESSEQEESYNESDNESEYILPDVASRYLDEGELRQLSQEKIQFAINEIFARHGRCFKKAHYDEYFRSKSWYYPDSGKTDEQIMAELNDYEKANEALLEHLREG